MLAEDRRDGGDVRREQGDLVGASAHPGLKDDRVRAAPRRVQDAAEREQAGRRQVAVRRRGRPATARSSASPSMASSSAETAFPSILIRSRSLRRAGLVTVHTRRPAAPRKADA
ncbi:hypothetical protein [Actinomadura madurae]|uniref:hypothetical protein n=1 Tax=Actinomadura madurae TaxID=1993 RepID=UPI0027E330FB|nr:hypothetical protein [Actinomadura madurae]